MAALRFPSKRSHSVNTEFKREIFFFNLRSKTKGAQEIDSVLKRKTNRPPVTQAHMVPWCHAGRDVGPRSSTHVCVCVCVCARLPIPVAGNTWRVYVRSQERLHPLEIRLTSCLQIPFFVRCWWWRLISSVQWWSCESACLRGNEATTAPGFFVTCRKLHLQLHPLRIIRRTCADHQRACVGWDDSIDTIVCAHSARARALARAHVSCLCNCVGYRTDESLMLNIIKHSGHLIEFN